MHILGYKPRNRIFFSLHWIKTDNLLNKNLLNCLYVRETILCCFLEAFNFRNNPVTSYYRDNLQHRIFHTEIKYHHLLSESRRL